VLHFLSIAEGIERCDLLGGCRAEKQIPPTSVHDPPKTKRWEHNDRHGTNSSGEKKLHRDLQGDWSASGLGEAVGEAKKLVEAVEEEQAKRFALPKASQAHCLQVLTIQGSDSPTPLPLI